jgi:hypothetical protein
MAPQAHGSVWTPPETCVFIAMIQRMHRHDNQTLEYKSHAAVYSALV